MSKKMEIVERTLTEDAMEDALSLVTAMDKSEEQAAIAMQCLISFKNGDKTVFHAKRDRDAIEALIGGVIPFALTNPGGRVEHILRKRGFLEPEMIKEYDFKTGSN